MVCPSVACTMVCANCVLYTGERMTWPAALIEIGMPVSIGPTSDFSASTLITIKFSGVTRGCTYRMMPTLSSVVVLVVPVTVILEAVIRGTCWPTCRNAG